MTVNQPVNNLLFALLDDLSDLSLLIQASVLLTAALAAWLLTRYLRGRVAEDVRTAWHTHEWGRFLIPLATLLLVLAARPVLAAQHLGIHLLNLAVPLLLSMFVIQSCFFLLRQVFRPGNALRAVERLISWMIWGAVALHITGHLGELTSAMDAIGFSVGKQRISLYTAFLGVISIVLTLVVAMWLARVLEGRFIAASGLDTNLKVALSKLTRALLLVVAVLIALPLVGIDITVLSVFGGALGVGLGLGLQKLASNYVSGFTLLLDKSLRIGDMVMVDGRFGEITEIATRYTVIRGLDGSETIYPNETLITSAVTNHSMSGQDNMVNVPIQVAYGTDLRKVERLLLELALQHPRVIKERHPPVVRLANFGESGIDMRLVVWITDPESGQAALVSDLNWAIWEAFQREGVEIPYPQRVVHLQQG